MYDLNHYYITNQILLIEYSLKLEDIELDSIK